MKKHLVKMKFEIKFSSLAINQKRNPKYILDDFLNSLDEDKLKHMGDRWIGFYRKMGHSIVDIDEDLAEFSLKMEVTWNDKRIQTTDEMLQAAGLRFSNELIRLFTFMPIGSPRFKSGMIEEELNPSAFDNQVILERRLEKFESFEGPRVGDYVIMSDGKYERICIDNDDRVQTTEGGSFHLGDSGKIGYSGGCNPSISKRDLIITNDTKLGGIWFFNKDDPRAQNGVNFKIPFRVYRYLESKENN